MTNTNQAHTATDTVPSDGSMSTEFIRSATKKQLRGRFSPTGWFNGQPAAVRTILILAFLAFLYVLPWLTWLPLIPTTGSDFSAVLTTLVVPYVLIALGLNVVVGQAGLLDLGYVGFFAIGAYTMGVLTVKHWSWSGMLWLAALVVSVTVTALLGVALGAPTLRLRGDYLAIVTLGFGEIIRIVAKNTSFLGAAEGISGIPSLPSFLFFKIDVLESRWLWTIGLSVIILVIFLLGLLERSRIGRAWAAIREDEDAAELMGVPTFRFKLLAFAIGAAIGGLGGVFYTTRNSAIYENQFAIQQSILFLAAVVLGGLGNRYGAVLGGFLVAYAPERLRFFADKRYFVFGLVLVLMMIFRPQGLLPRRVKAREAESGGPSRMGLPPTSGTAATGTAGGAA
jgi:branched-chain amino acid transport system permease protein